MQLLQKNNLLPWLDGAWQHLRAAQKSNRLAHAYLLTGSEGIGKNQLANAFSSSLLCLNIDENGFACEECTNCQLLAAQSYPNFVKISPEEGSRIIKVDQIRKLVEFSTKTANGYKAIIINPADGMNISASNALLKTLEEPGKDTIIFLITNQLSLLSATIRSRCQILKVATPTDEQALDWLSYASNAEESECILALKLSQNAPLKALELLESGELTLRDSCFKAWISWQQNKTSLLKLVETFQEIELEKILYYYMLWIMDLIKLKSACNRSVINTDIVEPLTMLAEKIKISNLFDYFDKLKEIKNLLGRKINLNNQLLLEDLLIQWQKTRGK